MFSSHGYNEWAAYLGAIEGEHWRQRISFNVDAPTRAKALLAFSMTRPRRDPDANGTFR